ncbi:MAG: DoxX family protein [Gemmatimonadetes bacterium]|nr:DoxX family protein [Gemmatimonadota bacterium]
MYEQLWPWLHLVSRLLFTMLFLGSAWSHLTKTGMLAGYAASKKLPAAALMVRVTGLMMLVGGILVLLGWHRFIGAGLIALFLFPTAFLMHNFWTVADPMARSNDQAHFMKDLSLAGAALYLMATSGYPWPLSLGG